MSHPDAQLPTSLYVHIPWCVRKCHYCDFNSHALESSRGAPPPEQEAAYLKALVQDLEQEARQLPALRLASVFIGGGTPSLMSGAFYRQLFEALRQHLELPASAEVTLEANPGTTDERHFQAYREAGINRISLGIQSFHNNHLQQLGRIHDAGQAEHALLTLKQAGFENFNIDLMHGLPGQTPEEALQDLHCALAVKPPHLSWYQLTIEPNTLFYSQPPVLPEDDTLWDIQQQGEALLDQAGLKQYEISAYSRPGKQATHNRNYWEFGDYIGIGAGAHGKRSWRDEQGVLHIERYNKTRQPEAYLKRIGHYRAQTLTITEEERPFEFMMNALRLKEGAPFELFTTRTGLPESLAQATLSIAQDKGLVRRDRIQCTDKGYPFLNHILEDLL